MNNQTFITFVDHSGAPITIDVKQDGGAVSWVKPGGRVRFKIRSKAIALRMERIVVGGHAADFQINDLRVGTRSQFSRVADRPEDDGVPGDAFNSASGSFLCDAAQKAMDIAFDVTYRGKNPEGAPFILNVTCSAMFDSGGQ